MDNEKLSVNLSLKKQIAFALFVGTTIHLLEQHLLVTESHGMHHKVLYSYVQTAVLWLGCSAIVGYLWKKFPWEHQPIKHIVTEVVLILVYTNLSTWVVFLFINCTGPTILYENVGHEILITNLITLFITSLYEAIFFYKQWKWNFSKSVRLERDHLEARLEILKAQLNPHFLFNSLNSLASMLDEQPEAEAYVQDLSYFMRYILTNRENELVTVDSEMEMLNKYIALQKVRFEENLQVSVAIDVKVHLYLLPPLSLQILVENCIKHNIISSSRPLKITINTEESTIIVNNNLQIKQGVHSSGHGLKNIIERYSFYTQEKVHIVQNEEVFSVTLPLIQQHD